MRLEPRGVSSGGVLREGHEAVPRGTGGEVRKSSGLQVVRSQRRDDLGERHASLEEAGVLKPRSPNRQIALSPRKGYPPGLGDELDGNVRIPLPEAR